MKFFGFAPKSCKKTLCCLSEKKNKLLPVFLCAHACFHTRRVHTSKWIFLKNSTLKPGFKKSRVRDSDHQQRGNE